MRRIDRLSVRAHAFHRYAHHPLCERYAGELVPLGRRARLCRGCLAVAAGLLLGAGLGFALRAQPLGVPIIAALLPLALVLALQRGTGKVLRRLLPAAALGFLGGHGPLPTTLATLAVAAGVAWFYRRRGPNRAPCQSCPERGRQVCSGFAPIYRRERALQRRVGAWVRAR